MRVHGLSVVGHLERNQSHQARHDSGQAEKFPVGSNIGSVMEKDKKKTMEFPSAYDHG